MPLAPEPTEPTPRRRARVAAVALLLALATPPAACGGGSPPPPTPEEVAANAACTPKLDERFDPVAFRAAHEKARLLGGTVGTKNASDYVERRTRDGYRLRRLTSTAVMALALLVVGALVGTLLLGLLGRRPPLHYAQRLGAAVDRELEAIRALKSESAAHKAIFARLDDLLLRADRASERLVDLCTPLERHDDDDPVSVQRLDELYTHLEAVVGLVERLHVRVVPWAERVAREPGDEAAVLGEVDEAVKAVDKTLSGLS
ncbi:MAG: hypothetical protein KC635_05100 [Myxococcales bacterium]|nr:hypothetical protein [Myxococcales bacterium]MCB9733093.1 hypothetical protein [Deltaproteobacteria bacterium]